MAATSQNSALDDPRYTYQDIQDKFKVSYRTVLRWWTKRRKLTPSPGTMRITQRQYDQWIKESGKKPKA